MNLYLLFGKPLTLPVHIISSYFLSFPRHCRNGDNDVTRSHAFPNKRFVNQKQSVYTCTYICMSNDHDKYILYHSRIKFRDKTWYAHPDGWNAWLSAVTKSVSIYLLIWSVEFHIDLSYVDEQNSVLGMKNQFIIYNVWIIYFDSLTVMPYVEYNCLAYMKCTFTKHIVFEKCLNILNIFSLERLQKQLKNY